MAKRQKKVIEPEIGPGERVDTVWVEVPPDDRPTREEMGDLAWDMGEGIFDPDTPIYRLIPIREWKGETLV